MLKSNKSKRWTAITALTLCVVTGSLHRRPIAQAAVVVPSVQYQQITRIVSRRFTIDVLAGPIGPVYTVTGENGRTLTDHITLAAMQQTHPEVFNSIAPAVATRTVDASIDTYVGD